MMARWWWWWRWQAVVVSALLLPVSLTYPAEEGTKKWAGAVVEVNLSSEHAPSDTHGHAHTRVGAERSTVTVIMEKKLYMMILTPSSWLVSPGATLSRMGDSESLGVHEPLVPRPCLYLARSDPLNAEGPSGTVSLCHRDGPRVLLMIKEELAELLPRPRFPPMPPTAHKRGDGAYTHVVKRHPLPGVADQDCYDYDTCASSPFPDPNNLPDLSQVQIDPTVQALYRHPSLGRQVDLTITHLRLLTKQPQDLKTHRGNRVGLLKSFCAYNQKNNDPDDSSPNHWDIGVYLSGLNFFVENAAGQEEGVTMGLAYTGGVCKAALSCIINELGTVNYRGHPYPSSGALSSYVLAHEIGHSLGLRHDGVSNACNSSGFIMAAGRSLRGATTWSSCAKDKILMQQGTCLKEGVAGAGTGAGEGAWNHTRFRGLPGQRWDATAQCQLFLRDADARVADLTKMYAVCTSVTCVSPHRISTYLAGPALEGTHCGGASWCRGGECVPWGTDGPGEVVAGGWGPWKQGPCTSDCVEGGTGYNVSRRACNSPPAVNSVMGCVGAEVQRNLCSDDQICSGKPRKTVNELASELCKVVSKYKPTIEGVGRQLSYSADTPWQACALYCQKKNSTSFWTPRYEFKDMPNVATHLPDGTPCNSGKFVCRDRDCVSQTQQTRGRSSLVATEDKLPDNDQSSDYQPMDVDDLFS